MTNLTSLTTENIEEVRRILSKMKVTKSINALIATLRKFAEGNEAMLPNASGIPEQIAGLLERNEASQAAYQSRKNEIQPDEF